MIHNDVSVLIQLLFDFESIDWLVDGSLKWETMNVFFVFYNFYLPFWGAMAVARFPENKHGVNFLLEIKWFDIILIFSCLRLLAHLAKVYIRPDKIIVTTSSSGFFWKLGPKVSRLLKFSNARLNSQSHLAHKYYLYRSFYGLSREIIPKSLR